jgi:hypothetical protein
MERNMDKIKPLAKVPFDELASERLSSEICSFIEQVDLHVQSSPRFLVMLSRGYISLTINLRVSAKKLLIWLSTLGGFIWAIVKVIAANWSNIQSLFVK